MFHDLNFSANDLEPFAARERSAAATTLGYSVVALNHTVLERLSAKDRCVPCCSDVTQELVLSFMVCLLCWFWPQG